uniref:WD_REPEATS_REGION domain-containing protein n=1 Tax=Angiostrongylus cantonensis TaxID=6313 RepID=A0A0K0DFT1_ANGCA
MSLKCIGSFVGSVAERYIIVLNEESEEYRCGLLMPSTTQDIFVYFSKDSSCALLTENSAFEKYSLTQVNSEHIASPCQFPSWIRGQYDSLTVTADWLQYDQLAEVAVTSRCVHVNENRVLVYSETKCTYATPADLRTLDCFNVSIDCDDSTKMKITASHCSTDVIFDSRQYQCIASWKDENSLYIYTTRDQQKHSCFVAQYSSNRLYLSSTGPHCIRDFNFSENSEKTIVLQEESELYGTPWLSLKQMSS